MTTLWQEISKSPTCIILVGVIAGILESMAVLTIHNLIHIYGLLLIAIVTIGILESLAIIGIVCIISLSLLKLSGTVK